MTDYIDGTPHALSPFDFFRRTLPNFARLAAPFNKKLRKYQPKQLSCVDEKKSTAVATLKIIAISLPMLALLKSNGQ